MFHDHEQVSDDEMKKKLKEMLENDKMCADKLKELKKNGITYDKFWDDKLISNVSILVIIYLILIYNNLIIYSFFLS